LAPIYSKAVRSALHAITSARATEEEKLDPSERLDLAAALEFLAIARMLEAQISADQSGD
jgi:hypothetical protein